MCDFMLHAWRKVVWLFIVTSFLNIIPMTYASNTFLKDFFIGCGSSAYQFEGAISGYGRGESIWESFLNTHPNIIYDNSTPEVSCDFYHKYKEDVQLLKVIGFSHFRLSIAWPRVLPTRHENVTNQVGIDFYHSVIDELLDNGIEPMVTLYHLNLPQPLQELGGWANPIMADYFVKYARLMFKEYGDKVKWWCTFNEPRMISQFGYGIGMLAPGVKQPGVADYLSIHTILLAHGKVYHLYKSQFEPTHKGKIGIVISASFFYPLTDSVEDRKAAARAMQFDTGIQVHPIFSKKGDYPEVVKEFVYRNSMLEGRTSSRLPVFKKEEIELLKGSADFLGVNQYTSQLATVGPVDWNSYTTFPDARIAASQHSSWPNSSASFLKSVPQGMRDVLKWIKEEYNNPTVVITENGWCTDGGLEDVDKIIFFHDYIEQMMKAIHEDGCNVVGYMVWSLTDAFEWLYGYTTRYGLYNVDFGNPERPRTKRKSADYIKDLIEKRELPAVEDYISIIK